MAGAGRRRQEERSALTRARLLDAAVRVFAESGYDGGTVDHLCRAAGRARGAFYLHFRSRFDIFLAALEASDHPRLLADALALTGRPGADAERARRAISGRLADSHDLAGLLALGQRLEEPLIAASARGRRRAA